MLSSLPRQPLPVVAIEYSCDAHEIIEKGQEIKEREGSCRSFYHLKIHQSDIYTSRSCNNRMWKSLRALKSPKLK